MKKKLIKERLRLLWENEMKKGEIDKIIDLGSHEVITLDPNIKQEITRKQTDALTLGVRSHLAKRKKVHIIIVKE